MSDFSGDIKNFVRRCGDRHLAVVKETTRYLYSGVVQASPILTMRYRDSWRIGVDEVDESVEDVRKVHSAYAGMGGVLPPSSEELEYLEKMLKEVNSRSAVYLTNSLPYAELLEQGYSNQAPGGVSGITYDLVKAQFPMIVAIALGKADADAQPR